MDRVKAIHTEQDYEAALTRIDALMDAEPGTPEGDELDVLADLVEHYEDKRVPMGFPTPIAAIHFRMEQAGLTPRDLIPYIGSRSKISEVLSGKRPLTLPMARALHEHLKIPSEVLLRDSQTSAPVGITEYGRFPIAEMARKGWIPKVSNPRERASEAVGRLMQAAGGQDFVEAVLYRKNDQARANAKTDPFALTAWCLKVLVEANKNRPTVAYKPGSVTLEFLRELVRLSWSEKGPQLAKEHLSKNGIAVVAVPHLSKTHLDGAALKLRDGTPVVGLTLRYDRLDNFWFCLLHELAHIGRHMDTPEDAPFVDDLSLRDVVASRDPREAQADEWAEEASVPDAIWQSSEARLNPTPMAVVTLAKALQIHPAIVAGKIRHETKNYRLLSHFVGSGCVRAQLMPRR
jgi:HTH-type transcriptional regulator / antitoxin HigA